MEIEDYWERLDDEAEQAFINEVCKNDKQIDWKKRLNNKYNISVGNIAPCYISGLLEWCKITEIKGDQVWGDWYKDEECTELPNTNGYMLKKDFENSIIKYSERRNTFLTE